VSWDGGAGRLGEKREREGELAAAVREEELGFGGESLDWGLKRRGKMQCGGGSG
jgi:hypothetical protein